MCCARTGAAIPCTAYVFVGIERRAVGHGLASCIEVVSSDEEWRDRKPSSHHNVAVTCTGLRALGVPEAVIGTFSDEFREGMAARQRCSATSARALPSTGRAASARARPTCS